MEITIATLIVFAFMITYILFATVSMYVSLNIKEKHSIVAGFRIFPFEYKYISGDEGSGKGKNIDDKKEE